MQETIQVTKFMPELMSAEELLMLADCYQARIEALTEALNHRDKGTEEHFVLNAEMGGLVRRRRYLVKTARHRQQQEREFAPAKPKAQRG